MCKVLIIIGMGLFFCGCSEPKPSTENLTTINKERRPLVTKKYEGCKLLASGYLVCPKAR